MKNFLRISGKRTSLVRPLVAIGDLWSFDGSKLIRLSKAKEQNLNEIGLKRYSKIENKWEEANYGSIAE